MSDLPEWNEFVVDKKTKELAMLVKALYKTQQVAKTLEEEIEQTEDILSATDTYVHLEELRLQLRELSRNMNEMADSIKEHAVAISGEGGFSNKHPVPGVTIKRFNVIKIVDVEAAKMWAAVNCPSALEIKKSALDQAVKGTSVAFIAIDVQYKAQLDRDLSWIDTWIEDNNVKED